MNPLSPSELARLSGVSRDTLRHYERFGLLTSQRTASGYRRYPADAERRVRLIRRALMVGFSLKELAAIFAERTSGGAPCRSVRASVAAHLEELKVRLKEMQTLKRDLEGLLSDWDVQLAATPNGKQARLLEQLGNRDGLK
jgi:DNA-binding transcriptional MerR regulator